MISSFYPAVPGRTSTVQTRYRMLYQLGSDESAIQNLQLQLSTGRRVNTPSDDLPAAVRAIGIQAAGEFKTQLKENLSTGQSFLSITETSLAQVQNLLIQARGTAVSAVDSTLSDTQREALAQEVLNSVQGLIELGNGRFRDRYLFGGSELRSPPFEQVNNTVRYNGDELDLQTLSDYGSTLQINVDGQSSFGVISAEVTSSVDLNPSVQPSTRLEDLNAGAGVARGGIRISNGLTPVEIDLSHAETLQDVADILNNTKIGNRQLSVNLNANNLRVDYADGLGGLMRIEEINTGTTAAQLGIKTISLGSTAPITGSDIDPIIRPETRLDQLFSGAGINLTQGFRIQQGGKTFTVNTSTASTVEDFLNAVEASGASVTADIAPGGKGFRIRSNESGSDFSIGENGGSLANALGLRTFANSTPLSTLNYGRGVSFGTGTDLVFTRNDGTTWELDLEGALTVGDVINKINLDPNNAVAGTKITASLTTLGNGLVLTTPAGTQPVKVAPAGGSQAIWDLGLISKGSQSGSFATVGSNQTLNGKDPSAKEVGGAFNSLLRLQQAIEKNDLPEIERAVQLLDLDLDRLSLSRGELGARQQRVDQLLQRTDDQITELTANESKEIDADLATVISELQARQAALQASLQLIGQAARLTLFDYL